MGPKARLVLLLAIHGGDRAVLSVAIACAHGVWADDWATAIKRA